MELPLTNVRQISIIACVLSLNFVLTPNITFAQPNNITNESATNSSTSTSNRNENSVFSFYFKEEGGLLPVNNYLLFDNLSKDLVHINLITDTISEKTVQNSETKNLRDAVLAAHFFDLKPVYLGTGADVRDYLLTITEGTKSNTVSWKQSQILFPGMMLHKLLRI